MSDDESAGALRHLGATMSRVARELQGEHGDVEATPQAITAAAVPDADECGISYVIRRSQAEPRASTSDLPRLVDELQSRFRQGPCLDAIWDHEIVRVADMAHEQRWPDFAPEAAALGARSMLCFQLFVAGDHLGALNLYSRTPDAFDGESREIG